MADAKLMTELADLKKQVADLTIKVTNLTNQVQKSNYSSPSNYVPVKQCKCSEPLWTKSKTITKFGGEEFRAYKITVAYMCVCGGHFKCQHVCQMYHCNTPLKCGFTFCESCFEKRAKQKEYEEQGKTCCRCKAIANPFIEPEGSFCSDQCRLHAAWYG